MTQHKTQTMKIEDLVPYDRNPRRGDVAAIKESLASLGQFKTIVVNLGTHTGTKNQVLAGNHTLAAARELGWKTLSCTVVDVDAATAGRIVLADNRTSDRATYDDDLLLELLQSLPSLEGTGYDGADVSDLLADLEASTAAVVVPKSPTPARSDLEKGVPLEGSKFGTRQEWEDSSRRLIVLDMDRALFAWAQDQLTKLAEERGKLNNVEVIVELLMQATGSTPPGQEPSNG